MKKSFNSIVIWEFLLGLIAIFWIHTVPICDASNSQDEQWEKLQAKQSWHFLLESISVKDGAPGSVIASPSREDPNYYFHWVRDSALVIRGLVEKLKLMDFDSEEAIDLRQKIEAYIEFSKGNQKTINLSGGVGEPKFNVDGSVFFGDWGRPQNDGPALRAITLMKYAQMLLEHGKEKQVREILYDGNWPTDSVIKTDLEYISHHWWGASFDLWEEVSGHHFYTRVVQYSALKHGVSIASALSDFGAARWYQEQADRIYETLEYFWVEERQSVIPTIDAQSMQSKVLDSAVVLAFLHTSEFFDLPYLWHNRCFRTMIQLKGVFESEYQINRHLGGRAPMIGRYPADTYDGVASGSRGNPWFLTTLAVAEYLYRWISSQDENGELIATSSVLAFLSMIRGDGVDSILFQEGQTYPKGTLPYHVALNSLRNEAQSYLDRIKEYRTSDGNLSEQVDRDRGFQRGARDLSWSHLAFLMTYWKKEKLAPIVLGTPD